MELAAIMARRIVAEPDFGKEIYELFAGPEFPPADRLDEVSLKTADMDRIKGIIELNAFSTGEPFGDSQEEKDTSSKVNEVFRSGTGLWTIPSFFNHSCVGGNIQRFHIGDIMVVRSKDFIIRKGTELVFTYVPMTESFEKRTKALRQHAFQCQCELCKFERAEPKAVTQQRKKLMASYTDSLAPRVRLIGRNERPSAVNGLLQEVASNASALRNTRSERPEFNFALIGPLDALAYLHRVANEPQKALDALQESYNLMATEKGLLSYKIALGIANIYTTMGTARAMRSGLQWFDKGLTELAETVLGRMEKDAGGAWRERAIRILGNVHPVSLPLVDMLLK